MKLLNISTCTAVGEAGGSGTPASSGEGPTFTLDELLSVFDAKLFCTSPRRAAAAGAAASGGAFTPTLHSNGSSGGSIFGTPESPCCNLSSAFEAEQRNCGAAFAAVAQALSPGGSGVCRNSKGWFAAGQALNHSPLSEAWGSGSYGQQDSSSGRPDGVDSPAEGQGLGFGWLAWSDSDHVARSGGGGGSGATNCDGTSGSSSSTGPGEVTCAGSSNSAAGGGSPGTPRLLGDDDSDDAVCVVEVAMAAAVEATTRPPRGGRGGKHRQKAKLNASLQRLAGHPDSEGAHAYVESALSAYRRNHPGDAAALELLTRHLAYLIGGVARYRLAGAIPWTQLPVPEPHELADKSRTPSYKTWLQRLGVVGADAFDDGPVMAGASHEADSGAATVASPRAIP